MVRFFTVFHSFARYGIVSEVYGHYPFSSGSGEGSCMECMATIPLAQVGCCIMYEVYGHYPISSGWTINSLCYGANYWVTGCMINNTCFCRWGNR